VGREEECSSSNQPELAAYFLALRDTPIEEPLLYLCDNRSLLKAVTRWIGEGGKATLVGAPDADILAAAIEILWKRIAAGTATFLVKVKAHRGEPANEEADTLVDKAISDLKVGREWCQRTNRAVCTWKKVCREAGKVTCQDRHSTFNNSVRDAIWRGAAENGVQNLDRTMFYENRFWNRRLDGIVINQNHQDSPLHRGNASNKNGPARTKRPNRWPLMTLCFCRNEKRIQKSA